MAAAGGLIGGEMADGDTIAASRVAQGTDLVEWYFEQGWTDGLPVVPPTPEAVDAVVAALGGEPEPRRVPGAAAPSAA